jgi:hypothetical protein
MPLSFNPSKPVPFYELEPDPFQELCRDLFEREVGATRKLRPMKPRFRKVALKTGPMM